MENRPFPIPTGEAFLVKTPYLDEVGKRLYREQQQRELQQRADSKALDDEFTKNVAGVRDADVGGVVQKYGDYKNLWKQLNKKGAVITPEQQLELLRKKADILGHIAKSKQEKEVEELAAKDLTKNPNNFEPNAHGFLIERRKLPVDKFQVDVPNPKGKPFKMDMSNIYDNILYKGSNTDFTPVFKKATGTPQLRGVTVTEKTPDGLSNVTTTFKAINPPGQQFQILNESRKGSNWEKDFLIKHDYDDAEGNEIVNQYEALKQTPEFKNAYGDTPDIPASAFTSKLGRAMALTTMKNAIQNPPVAVKGKSQVDIGETRKWKEGFAKTMEAIKQANRKELLGMRVAAKEAGEAANDLWIDSYIDKLEEDAAASPNKGYAINKNGTRIKEDRIALDAVLSKVLSKDGVSPDQLAVQPDGNVRPIFYQRDKEGKPVKDKNDNYVVDEIASVPISKQQLKLSLGGKVGTKQLNKEMTPKGDKPLPKGKPRTVVQNGHTYYYNEKTGNYE